MWLQQIIRYIQFPEQMSLPTEQIMKCLNLAREYPKYYLCLLDEQMNSFADDLNIRHDKNALYRTVEGVAAWKEARHFLINQEPLRPLEYHQGLTQACFRHGRDLIKNRADKHQGADGSTFIDRVQRFCKKGKGNLIQIIGNTHRIPGKNSIELAVLNLIIDDGVVNRGDRKALFNEQYKYVGFQFAISGQRIISVIVMSEHSLQLRKASTQDEATSNSSLKVNGLPYKESLTPISQSPSEVKQVCEEWNKTDQEQQSSKIRTPIGSILKSNGSESSGSHKKVVEKTETLRSWEEGQFQIREIATIIKYEDGSLQNLKEKHSVLRNNASQLKEYSH